MSRPDGATTIRPARSDDVARLAALHRECFPDYQSSRLGVAFSTRLFLNSLVQVNTLDREVSANVRLNYMYRPGSDLYLVLNEQRGDRVTPWEFKSRGVRLKLTYLLRL